MAITVYKKTLGTVDQSTVRKILFSQDAIVDAIIEEAVTNMAEANVDMILDDQERYDTKEKIETAFKCDFLNQITYDMIIDVMDGLKSAVLKKLKEKQYHANVTAMHFNGDDGELSDVDVRIKF